ncbi:MAG TPA: hypothetical protein DGP89_06740, partial [Saprospirales bacterium]|nr:hypothetical protein [Saprospirales bacterium]
MAIMISSCATKKRKDEVSGFKKFYHTFTSKYNGYFNANELMEESFATLETSRQDNYNQILPIYTYTDVDNPKMVASQLDLAIEKVIRVATIHELGEYLDDCYVLMGKAQYLKQDYETAQETFEFFQEEFNPTNPYGSNYKKKKKSIKQRKRDRDIEKENQKELKKKEKEEKEEQREKDRKQKEKLKKEAKKAKEEGRKKRKKEKKEEEKRRKKEREDRKKSNKRNKKSGGKKKRAPKDEKEKEETESIIEVKETKADLVKDEASSDVESELNLIEEDQKEVAVSEDVGEEEVIPKKKKEKKEDNTAYSEGMLWLAKTYIERGKYSNAEYLLRKLSQSMVKKEVEREIPVAKSYLYMVQKEYDKAIPELRKAIDVSNDGKLKARYAYIIAQLYQNKNDYANALSAFQEVKDHKGNFRMDFNADLSIEKNGLLAGTESNELASKKINKMLGEEKYSEFRDQIYFTLGEISLAQNNDKEALINFTLSIRNNLNNPPLKSEAYYYMATLNFEKEEYVAAKYYYDSTLMSMNKLDERYNEVSLYTKNLSRIARNIETIELQDSLLFLSGLSQEKLDKLADMLVLEQRAADEEVEINKSKGKTSQPKMGSGRQNSRKRGFGNSKFFAYNLAAKEKGANEFRKRWGDRKLEDNWRRLDSQSFNTFDDEDVEEEEEKEITDAERK